MPRRSRPRISLRSRPSQIAKANMPRSFSTKSFAIFLVEMKNDFRIRGGAEGMAAAFEIGAQFSGVIGFSVVGDPGLAILAGHGHAPAFAQVDDGEARVYQETRSEIPGLPGCQDRGVSWPRPCGPRPDARIRLGLWSRFQQCRTYDGLPSDQRKPPAGHGAQMSWNGDRLGHFREERKAIQYTDQEPQIGVIHKVLIELHGQVHEQNKNHHAVPPDREAQWKIDSFAKLPYNFPSLPEKDRGPNKPENGAKNAHLHDQDSEAAFDAECWESALPEAGDVLHPQRGHPGAMSGDQIPFLKSLLEILHWIIPGPARKDRNFPLQTSVSVMKAQLPPMTVGNTSTMRIRPSPPMRNPRRRAFTRRCPCPHRQGAPQRNAAVITKALPPTKTKGVRVPVIMTATVTIPIPTKAILGVRLAGEQEVSLRAHGQNPKQNQVEGKAARADEDGTRRERVLVGYRRVSDHVR